MIHNKPSRKAEEIGYKISQFFLEKNNRDYKKAQTEIESLRITNIVSKDDGMIDIYLSSPGLLIGRKGRNIDALTIYLKCHINVFESFHWNDILIQQDYELMENC